MINKILILIILVLISINSAFSEIDGSSLWSVSKGSLQKLTVDSDTLYVCSSVGKIYAIDTTNGADKWNVSA